MDIPVYSSFEDMENKNAAKTAAAPTGVEGDDLFFFEMNDDSMEPRFAKGSPILCRCTQKAKPGSTVIFAVGQKYYLRNMTYDKDFLTFFAENKEYEDIFFAGVNLRSAKIKAIVVE
ncbi:MAG: hypothetical protein DBX47_04010 [Clostridiales bacterium]|nr:MAG: hypothetical protein DBX47_04010 [Clostridiales bacterium]